jgi:hypothetical protein
VVKVNQDWRSSQPVLRARPDCAIKIFVSLDESVRESDHDHVIVVETLADVDRADVVL